MTNSSTVRIWIAENLRIRVEELGSFLCVRETTYHKRGKGMEWLE